MPLNVYECTKCGYEFEEIQKFSDPPLKKCPECDGKLNKQLGSPSLQFKGGGWASDGYGNSKNSKSKVVNETKEALTSKPD